MTRQECGHGGKGSSSNCSTGNIVMVMDLKFKASIETCQDLSLTLCILETPKRVL